MNVALIAGLSLGGILILLIVAFVVFYCQFGYLGSWSKSTTQRTTEEVIVSNTEVVLDDTSSDTA